MGHGDYQLDVAGAFAAHFLLGDFHTATVADDTFVTNALVLSAMAFVVLGGTENAFAEQTVALGLIGAVVDGFGLQNLTIRISHDFFGRS